MQYQYYYKRYRDTDSMYPYLPIYTYHCDSTPYLHEYTVTDCINSPYDRQLDDTYTNWGIELTNWAGDTGDTMTTRWVTYMTQAHRVLGGYD